MYSSKSKLEKLDGNEVSGFARLSNLKACIIHFSSSSSLLAGVLHWRAPLRDAFYRSETPRAGNPTPLSERILWDVKGLLAEDQIRLYLERHVWSELDRGFDSSSPGLKQSERSFDSISKEQYSLNEFIP